MKISLLVPLAVAVTSLSSNTGYASSAQAAKPAGNKHTRSYAPHALRRGAEVLRETNRPSEELTLASDLEIAELAPLARAWADRSETICYEMTTRDGVPARMAIRQVRGKRCDTVYVCIHGLFGESENWKYLVGALGGQNEVWALDLVGSGLSDCPDPERVGPGGYSPEALADRALQALQARLAARPEVSKILITGHSLGGMVALRMFMAQDLRDRYASVLARVEGLALFAPCDVLVSRATDDWTGFFAITSVKAGLGSALRILQFKVVESVRNGFCNPQLASRELAASGIRVVREAKYREATKAMMRDAVRWQEFGKHADYDESQRLEEAYQKVTVPCLVVWGKCDETFPEATGYKIKDQLPDARLVVMPQSKHMLPMERPRICADLMRQFDRQIANGGLSAAHTVQKVDPATYEKALLAGQP